MPFEKWNIKHHNEAEKDTAKVIKMLDRLILEIATYLYSMKIAEGIFKFNSFPALNKNVGKLFQQYNFSVQASIDKNMVKHWNFSQRKTNLFSRRKVPRKYRKSISTRNAEGLQAFRNKRNKEISNRVWRQGKQLRNELEMAIDTAIKDGTPANQLATEIKKYLKQPDKLFRRYRDNNGQLQLSKNALSYNPGQGVYRSSYKNAERLARTEINMAYRLADIERWQDLDFIVGYEIKRSKHPYPCTICEMMAGKYPKDFVWSGNHPNCRCYLVPIFKDDTDNVEINPKFTKWVNDNQDKIQRARSLPYFLRDNPKYVTKAVKSKINAEKITEKLNYYKGKVSNKAKKIFSGLLSDATGGFATLGIAGINKAIELYSKKKINAEKVAILKGITEMKDFKAIKNLSTKNNTLYGFNIKQYEKLLRESEMPKNIVIAKKLLNNNHDVYLLPNVTGIKSADFITVKNKKYYYYEAKTINGKSTLKARLQEASTQSDRIILDVVGINNPKEIAENVRWFFNNFNTPTEVLLFKRGRIIKVTRRQLKSKNFVKNFEKEWVGKSKKKRF